MPVFVEATLYLKSRLKFQISKIAFYREIPTRPVFNFSKNGKIPPTVRRIEGFLAGELSARGVKY